MTNWEEEFKQFEHKDSLIPKEVAKILRCSPRRVQQLCKLGIIPSKKRILKNSRYQIPKEPFKKLLEENPDIFDLVSN